MNILLFKKVVLYILSFLVLLYVVITVLWHPRITQQFEGSTAEFVGLYVGQYHDSTYADGPTYAKVLTTRGIMKVEIAGYRAICKGEVRIPAQIFSIVRVSGYMYASTDGVSVCKSENFFIR